MNRTQVLDKNNILDSIDSLRKVVLEIGCGPNKVIDDSIGIDALDLPGVDIVADINEGLGFLGDGSVDEIYSFHFLEHLSDVGAFMKEVYRVLKVNGKMIGTVPHFSNPYYYSDYSHVKPFGLYTLSYFCQNQPYKRKVPSFYNNFGFALNESRIIFASPFKYRSKIKKLWQIIFNCNKAFQEFYEENCCFLIPAFEIKFEVEKVQ